MTQRGKPEIGSVAWEHMMTMHALRHISWDSLLQGLSGREFHFLRTIDMFKCKYPEKTGIYVNDLAEKMGVTKSGASKMLQQLEKRGFIVREIDPTNRRNTYVSLTDGGHHALAMQKARMEEFLHRVADTLGEERFRQILSDIREMTEVMSREITAMEQENQSTTSKEETQCEPF